jgi:hypothetical protein
MGLRILSWTGIIILIMLSQIFLLSTIMCTYVWLWENKIMRTVKQA